MATSTRIGAACVPVQVNALLMVFVDPAANVTDHPALIVRLEKVLAPVMFNDAVWVLLVFNVTLL